MAEEFTLDRIDKARYRPTREAEEFLTSLRRTLVSGEKFLVARLALARSLVEGSDPPLLERGTEMGSGPIEGQHLFGEDKSVWACLVTEAAGQPARTLEAFRALVEAHWHRGARLLQTDLESVGNRDADFAILLAGLAGDAEQGSAEGGTRAGASEKAIKLTVRIGEVGLDVRKNEPVDVVLNGQGTAPHLALMGKTRSGKTRTGISIAEQITKRTTLPFLFIDPKGEFVRDGTFVPKSEWQGKTFADRFPGAEPLDVPLRPLPLDFLALPRDAPESTIAPTAIAFRDSFRKCIRNRGDVAMDDLREVVHALLATNRALSAFVRSNPVSLERIRDAFKEKLEDTTPKKNSVLAKLNELTSLRLFEPSMPPAEFFRRRWVIGLGTASDESRRLVMFLLLDALANYALSLEPSSTDGAGCRAVRHLLVVDEANEILSYRHEALSKLIRRGAAQGQVVMLLSQSPEDFDQEEDDFLSQMGTIAVFASSAKSVKNLRSALGKKINPEDFGDKELGKGVAIVKVPGREPIKVLAWK